MGEKGNPNSDKRTDSETETSLERGLRQAAAGELVYLGSFTQTHPVDRLLRYASYLGFPLALGLFFVEPPVDMVFLITICVLGVVVVGGSTLRMVQAKRRATNVTIDHLVYTAVKRNPGHCATSYAKIVNGEHQLVQRSLARLVAANHLKTHEERFTEEVPYVTVYEPT